MLRILNEGVALDPSLGGVGAVGVAERGVVVKLEAVLVSVSLLQQADAA